jgi:BarA-like signal transduction histidine kinase
MGTILVRAPEAEQVLVPQLRDEKCQMCLSLPVSRAKKEESDSRPW